MPKLKNLFTVPEGQKVTEKHLRRVLISSVISILLCMTCLVSTTWAWFTVSITSTDNQIELGMVASAVEIVTPEDQSLLTELPCTLGVGSYQVRITNTGTSNGYFRLEVADNTGEAKGVTTPTVRAGDYQTIEVTVRSGEAVLTVTDYWGESPVTQAPQPIIAGLPEPEPEPEPEEPETPPVEPGERDDGDSAQDSDDGNAEQGSDVPAGDGDGNEEEPDGDNGGTTPETTIPATGETEPEETTTPPTETTAPEEEQTPDLV